MRASLVEIEKVRHKYRIPRNDWKKTEKDTNGLNEYNKTIEKRQKVNQG